MQLVSTSLNYINLHPCPGYAGERGWRNPSVSVVKEQSGSQSPFSVLALASSALTCANPAGIASLPSPLRLPLSIVLFHTLSETCYVTSFYLILVVNTSMDSWMETPSNTVWECMALRVPAWQHCMPRSVSVLVMV